MDVMGAMQIDVQFSAVAAANRAVVVDLSEVEFLASMGLRTLIMGAKSMQGFEEGPDGPLPAHRPGGGRCW